MPPDQADVVVVGLGAVGSALACQLALRGARVTGIDRFHPPHELGSSHGRTRITRLAVGEGAAFVPLVQRSHELWRHFEDETGLELMRSTGVLTIASPAARRSMFHGVADFFDRTCSLALQYGIRHELLDAREVRERFPAFEANDGDAAYLEPDGGVLFPEACIRAQWQLARASGARLLGGERLLEVVSSPGSVALRTDRATHHAAQAVLCTGAWLPAELGPALQARLRVLRQTLHWFACERPRDFEPERCPAFIWLHGPDQEDAFYGFPAVDGLPAVKAATEQLLETADPDLPRRAPDPGEAIALHERHLRGRVRGLLPRTVHEESCLYTMAADGNFLIGRHPRHERVTIVSACSGHGFKHSAALGEALAQRTLGELPAVSLEPFAIPA